MKAKFTKKTFIAESNKIHFNKYDYSKVDYKNMHTKIIIICPIHGEFEQLPQNHIRGFGCKKCGFDLKKLSQEEFIEKSNKIHNNFYDYSKTEYITNRIKVCIPALVQFIMSLQSPRQITSG